MSARAPAALHAAEHEQVPTGVRDVLPFAARRAAAHGEPGDLMLGHGEARSDGRALVLVGDHLLLRDERDPLEAVHPVHGVGVESGHAEVPMT